MTGFSLTRVSKGVLKLIAPVKPFKNRQTVPYKPLIPPLKRDRVSMTDSSCKALMKPLIIPSEQGIVLPEIPTKPG